MGDDEGKCLNCGARTRVDERSTADSPSHYDDTLGEWLIGGHAPDSDLYCLRRQLAELTERHENNVLSFTEEVKDVRAERDAAWVREATMDRNARKLHRVDKAENERLRGMMNAIKTSTASPGFELVPESLRQYAEKVEEVVIGIGYETLIGQWLRDVANAWEAAEATEKGDTDGE